jgi:hypothetical protein
MQITMQATIQGPSGGSDVRVRTLDFGGNQPAIEIAQEVASRIDPASGRVCGAMILIEALQANELVEAIGMVAGASLAETVTVADAINGQAVVVEREDAELVVLRQEDTGRIDEVRISPETAPALAHLLTAALAIAAPALVVG